MSVKRKQESAQERFDRYQKAYDNNINWRSYLESIYNLVLPNRNTFFTRTPGEARNLDIFDSTASLALPIFASNIQSMLMPISRTWMRLKPGPNVKDQDKDSVQRQLDRIVEQFFFYLNRSNLTLELATAFQDMAISTGVILVNEGNDGMPFHFNTIPLSRVAFTESVDGRLENFWRDFKVPVESIQRQWPKAKLSNNLQQMMSSNPQEMVELIEGTIHYPDNPDAQQYMVYIQDKTSREDIYTEWRSYSPWIGFRFEKSPDDVFGRGPVEKVFPTIKELNQFAEFMLVSAKFNAYPAYMTMQSDIINPFSSIIQPGSLISVDSSFGSIDPIRPLKSGNNLQFSLEFIQAKQRIIKEALFADPLGSPETPNQSATEISVRQQNWIRQSSSSFGRLQNELVLPLVNKCLHILRKKGLVQDIKVSNEIIPIVIDEKYVGVEFISPISDTQNQDDLSRLDQYMQRLEGTFGQAGLLGLNIEDAVEYWSDKLNIPKKLMPMPGELQAKVKALANQVQGQAGSQNQSGQSPQPVQSSPNPIPTQLPTSFEPIGA